MAVFLRIPITACQTIHEPHFEGGGVSLRAYSDIVVLVRANFRAYPKAREVCLFYEIDICHQAALHAYPEKGGPGMVASSVLGPTILA